MPANELTEAPCYSRHSCSKLLLIDVTLVFSFGLVTKCCSHSVPLEKWRMASGSAKNKTLEQTRCFCTRMTFSHLLMVADGALKLNYASVIFVDHRVQIDGSSLDSLKTVAACHMQVLW